MLRAFRSVRPWTVRRPRFYSSAPPPKELDSALLTDPAGAYETLTWEKLKSTKEIAVRAACCHTILSRWGLEAAVKQNEGMTQSRHLEGDAGVRKAVEMLKTNFTVKEKALLDKKLGKWREKRLLQLQHYWESLGTLLWVLSLHQTMPDFLQGFDATMSFKLTGIVPNHPVSIENFINEALEVRNTDQVIRATREAHLWHWRTYMEALMEKSEEERDDIWNVIQQVARQAHADGEIDGVSDSGDFLIRDQGFGELTREQMAAVNLIAQARTFTLNWLAGISEWKLI
eukprot:Clim_evm73s147 gene=Clim_evmTU73s147